MGDMVNFVNSFNPKITPRGDLSGELENLNNQKEENLGPIKKYFNITDVAAPADHFAEAILGKEKTQELKKILNQGNKVHGIVQNWMKEHEDYFGSEGILDGHRRGISVRGKPDGRIRDSIVEIKSVKKLPESKEEIIEKYPQYIEQLAFYSVIDPPQPKEDYLLFVTREYPYEMKSFKISILDIEKIEGILKKRIHFLRQILEGREKSTIFGKCRFFCDTSSCNVYNQEKCPFHDKESLKCEIKDYIEISESPEFSEELKELRKKKGDKFRYYNPYNILHPRKYCLKQISDKEDNFTSKNDIERTYFSNLVYQFIKNNNLFLKEEEKSNFEEFGLGRYSWFLDKSSINNEGKITPFITHASNSYDFDKPHPYKIAELGVYLMAHGKSRGIVFQYYPQKNKVRAFEISFNFSGEYLRKLKEIIEGLKNPENFKNLPKCSFGCDDCVYREKCLKE